MEPQKPAQILVVEDEKELADTYARWLSDTHEVTVAYTGEQALDLLSQDLDVVLLDRRLPGIPGREVLTAVKETVDNCRVAMITAVDPDFDVLDMPFDDYLIKPVLKAELTRVVDRLVKLQTYDEQFQESFALANKRRILEAEKTRASLNESEEYAAIESRLDELREELDVTFAEFEDTDFETIYRELETGNIPDDEAS